MYSSRASTTFPLPCKPCGNVGPANPGPPGTAAGGKELPAQVVWVLVAETIFLSDPS